MTFLKQQIIQIDFEAGKLAFLRGCPSNAGSAFLLTYGRGGIPQLELDVGQDQFLSFEIDTGAFRYRDADLTPELFNRLAQNGQLTANGEVVHFLTVRGREAGRRGQLVRVRLDSFEHTNLMVAEADANRLTLQYLSRYVVTFDFENDRVCLRNGTRYE